MTYDDGRVLATTWSGGQMATHSVTDGADVFVWSSVTQGWDAGGRLDYRSILFDDGRVLDKDHVDGLRRTSIWTDNADAYAWDSMTKTWSTSGDLVERVTTWDNGAETVISFAEDAPLI